ncbi:hypothetical protein PR202_ga00169 [Eleusine coracana subsp. coracana]|uniref:Protein TIFY n=1 Tax=Eleusine coracana subsp. coracana TaxID=191504 RepID=A0AAV5BGC0_ELECO|nr:hypothetical protein QOZ80_2AG0123650 [Eleusine coracana subsp. coracana]GJM84492.1 hypothetical protein PR202_ga00169 [Eleusine coracana subsp. coracana]
MAAAAAGSSATVATTTTTSRFAAACGALSRYVKAAEMARVSRPPVARPLPLMPGADVEDAAPEGREEAGPAQSQLTIVYGGRVLVLDDVPADKAAGLLQLAAAAARGANAADLLPVARKASLQRFMEKRKGRVAANGNPYLRSGASADRHDELTLAL